MRNSILLGGAFFLAVIVLIASMSGSDESKVTSLQKRCEVLSRKYEKQYLPLMGTLLRIVRAPVPPCDCFNVVPCGCPKPEEMKFYIVFKSPQSKAQEIPVFTHIKDDYMMETVKTNQNYSMCIRVETRDLGAGQKRNYYMLDFFNTLQLIR